MCRAARAIDPASGAFDPSLTPALWTQWSFIENFVSLTVMASVLGGMLMALSPSVPVLPRHDPAIAPLVCFDCNGLPPGRPCRTQVDRRAADAPVLTALADCRRT